MIICFFLSLHYEGFDQVFTDEHKLKIIMRHTTTTTTTTTTI